MSYKEVDVAEGIIAFLEDMKWDVYQEVPLGGKVADIVAVQNNIVWIIETKTNLTFNLIEQAFHKKQFSNFTSIGVPSKGRSSNIIFRILRMLGLGMIEWGYNEVAERVQPEFRRLDCRGVIKCLEPEHKTYAKAGSKGGHWSPWKSMCRDIHDYVKRHPGCTLKELIEDKFVYYNGRSVHKTQIYSWLYNDWIPNVYTKKEGRLLKLHVKLKKIKLKGKE